MITFIYSLMTDKRKGAIFVPFKFALYIASLLYGLGIYCRFLLYRFGIFKSNKVPLKIISVGNLTLGGTGKTPFVICLIKLIKESLDIDASVLIRGYGWDEQAMLKKNLADTPILVGEDRTRSAHRAIKLYGSRAAILDDGFQHWELARDLDIVLVDSRNALGNGRLFPRGILREPKSAIRRADIVVFTKIDKKTADMGGMKAEFGNLNKNILFLEAVHRPKYFYDVKAREDLALDIVKGKRVVLLSSIGDPSYFEDTVKDLGGRIVEHIIYPDHHNYSARDEKAIRQKCDERSFEFIITTDKDAVKLGRMSISFGPYRVLVLAVEMEITSGKEKLVAGLNSVFSGPRA